MSRMNPQHVLALLMLLLVTTSLATPLPLTLGEIQTPKTLNSPVRFPLPTVPEPILKGTSIRVEVSAGQNATAWAARLVTEYGTSVLSALNSSYATNAGWTVFFQAPLDLSPRLYGLNVVYNDGASIVNYTQPRSVWIMDKWPETLKISQLTDIHLPYGADLFATYAYEVNLVQPDLVLATGDIVDTETISSAWVYLQTIMDRLTVPSYFLPGNHDHSGEGGAFYRRYCGPLNYSLTIGNFLLLTMDTADAGFISTDQLQWAEKVLQNYPEKVKIIAFHHPLFGSGDGGNITGHWENMEKLRDCTYYSWLEQTSPTHELRPEARELLRLVETYDVRLILSGHIHRDVIYVLNNKHYFITTSTLGGSLPTGSYHSSRLVEIDTKQNVKLDAYAGQNIFTPPNSIPIGHISWYYRTPNNGSKAAVSAVIINQEKQKLENAELEFRASTNYGIEDYKFYSTQPIRYENFTAYDGHHFIVHLDVPSESSVYITLAAVQDNVKPTVRIQPTEDVRPGKPVNMKVQATDEGWGIRNVQFTYSTNDGATWTSADLQNVLKVNKEEYVTEYPTAEYNITIPAQADGTKMLVNVKAIDFANNSETYQASYSIGVPAPANCSLRVDSSPVADIPLTIDGQNQKTPYSSSLKTGNHTVIAPTEYTSAGTSYRFARWDDGTTGTTKTVTLSKDTSLTVYYEAVAAPPQGIPLWQVLLLAAVVGIVVIIILLRARR